MRIRLFTAVALLLCMGCANHDKNRHHPDADHNQGYRDSRDGTNHERADYRTSVQDDRDISPDKNATDGMPGSDGRFVHDAAMGGMTEVQMSQIAVNKANADNVRRFAQRMIDDHSKANIELKSIASAQSMHVPDDVDAKHRAMIEENQTKRGDDFDKAYVNMMVDDHKEAVSLFEREATNGKKAKLRDFAQKTLPTLREHLQMIEDIQSQTGR